MTIRFHCPQCNKSLKAADEQLGKRYRCNGCGEIGTVPRGEATAGKVSAFVADEAGPDAAFRFKRRVELETEMDMTPMVDVTFLLLIFFMVTAAFAMQKAFESPTHDPNPEAVTQRPEEQQEDPDVIEVEIRAENDIWIGDHEAPTRQALLAALKDVRGERKPAPNTLLIKIDPKSAYWAKIMVYDAGQLLGMEKIREVPWDPEF